MPVFLFTDIEGSTALWEKYRPVMLGVLQQHDAILQSALDQFNGRLIKHTGDGIFAVFPKSVTALDCALAIQQQFGAVDWGEIGELKIRIGLDGCSVEREGTDYFTDGQDYFGPLINQTARVMDAGWGGQIVFSHQVLELAQLPVRASVQDFGEQQLKGMADMQLIYGLLHPDLPHQDFSTLRTISAQPNNLPLQPTPFIGRSAELATLDKLIVDPNIRLVTIVGPGGMGKTRLGLAVAENLFTTGQFQHGVYFVNLSPLSDASHIVSTVADALNFPLQGGERSPQQQLLDYLRQKEMLLLFDNFEHVLDGEDLLTEILQTAPKVQLLVTSRERLHFQTEQVYPIEGLEFPDWETVPPIGEIEDAEWYTAVQLFLQSAQRNQPDFALHDKDDLTYLARICRTVAGMPLALELAASWVDMLPLQEIADELQQGLDFLETDMRDMPERHRSIRAAIDYSWQKLDGQEQDIFAKLSVFRDGFTRKAAKAVAGANLRQLARLISKSLLQGGGGKDGRYQIHELLRQYGAEKLAENNGEEIVVRNAHSAYFCEALQKWEPELKGRQPRVTLTQIEADEDNIRIAWRWATEQKKWNQLDHAMNGLGRFYLMNGRRQEGAMVCQQATRKLKETISLAPKASTSTQQVTAKILAYQANLVLFLGQKDAVNRLLQESLTYLPDSAMLNQDSWLVKAHALFIKGLSALMYDADFEIGNTLLEQSLVIYQAQGDQWGEAWVLRSLGDLQNRLGFRQKARHSLEKSLVSFRALGDRGEEFWTLRSLSGATMNNGQLEEAEQFDQQSLKLATEMEDLFGQQNVLLSLAWLALFRGNLTKASAFFQEALILAINMDYEYYLTIPDISIGQSLVELHQGQYEEVHNKVQKNLSLMQEHGDGRLLGHFSLVRGCAALAEGEYTEAQIYLEGAINNYQAHQLQHFLVDALSASSMMMLKLGQQAKAIQRLYQALELVVTIRSYKWASPVASMALLMTELIQNERAIELYALAESDSLVKSSLWFADMVGELIEAVTATLPLHETEAAKMRGRELNLWQTAESLLTELKGLGWNKQNPE